MSTIGSAQNAARGLELFDGTILILAPHMDDEALACGGLVARLRDKTRIHIAFATDGMKSPAPVLPWRDSISADLGERRQDESRAAAAMLGVPGHNLHFLGLPEAQLRQHRSRLAELLGGVIMDVDPDHILLPFRYDRHLDHLAVNDAVTDAKRRGRVRATLTEYFIYYRWRLLPRGDIRRYIRPEHLISIDIGEVAELKRAALDCFTTQTTRYFEWQTRPILRPELLDEECVGPEIFVRYDPSLSMRRIFTGSLPWIRIAHRLEPRLVRWKYLLKSSLTRGLGASFAHTGSNGRPS